MSAGGQVPWLGDIVADGMNWSAGWSGFDETSDSRSKKIALFLAPSIRFGEWWGIDCHDDITTRVRGTHGGVMEGFGFACARQGQHHIMSWRAGSRNCQRRHNLNEKSNRM
ncbi:hypothetical protein ACRALDRAFT_1059506 [Sodiomyces alcalophilus JCM 7366]|uniref:uncharacterized protein n=1 Tax=Sodiomyces alcalophilus JCM 7366 TaxID=591952 RepID=UPI0039B5689E